MKRFIIPLVTVALVAALILAGCAPAVAPPEAPPVAPPAPPAEEGYPSPEVLRTLPAEEWPEPPNPMEGIGVKPNGEMYEFLMVMPFLYIPYPFTCNAMTKQLVERAGARYISLDAYNDVYKMCSIFEDALVIEPDAVVFCPIDGVSEIPSVEALVDAGIPVFTYCVPLMSEEPVTTFHAGTEYISLGGAAGEALCNYAEEYDVDLNVYAVRGWIPSVIDDGRRYEGVCQAVEECPRVTMTMTSGSCAWDPDLAMAAVLDTFPAHPELNAIYEAGSMVPGIVEALRILGRLHPVGHPDHVAIGATDEVAETIGALREGWIDGIGAHSCWEEVDVCTKVMLDYVCLGKPVPQYEVLIPSFLITSDNVDKPPRFGAPATWGEMMRIQPDYDLWPILDTTELGVETPTLP